MTMPVPPKWTPGPFRPSKLPPVPAAYSRPHMRLWQTTGVETLRGLAERLYGNPMEWIRIYNANSDVIDASGRVPAGIVLRIP